MNKSLIEKYLRIREASMQMVEPLQTEDFVPQPAEFVSPPKWNLAHTTWFFEEFILKHYIPGYEVFHPKYAYLFNSYYTAAGDRVVRHKRGDLSRPTVGEVVEYRRHVDELVLALFSKNNPDNALIDIFLLGLNHEQQHQELFFTDLKYTFSLNPLNISYSDQAFCETPEAGKDTFIEVPEGVYEIGYAGTEFCYDNELGRHKVFLQNYQIRSTLVRNWEYIEFLEDMAYENPEFWHDEGFSWIKRNHITKPLYWRKKEDGWYQYTLAGMRKIDPDHILTHINYYEAAAFAQWKGMRLPTEFEWEAAADNLSWGKRWEWTESAYLPYPGYKKAEGAMGEYNGKFMINQKVLRGASLVTPEGHSRKTYRNFFHPHMAYQFNGIRLAK